MNLICMKYFTNLFQRSFSTGVVMDKGLEHDVDQVEDQREEDVDHVGCVDETGLEPRNEIMQSYYSDFNVWVNSLLLPLDVNDGRQQDDDRYGDGHVVQDVGSLRPFPRIQSHLCRIGGVIHLGG